MKKKGKTNTRTDRHGDRERKGYLVNVTLSNSKGIRGKPKNVSSFKLWQSRRKPQHSYLVCLINKIKHQSSCSNLHRRTSRISKCSTSYKQVKLKFQNQQTNMDWYGTRLKRPSSATEVEFCDRNWEPVVLYIKNINGGRLSFASSRSKFFTQIVRFNEVYSNYAP